MSSASLCSSFSGLALQPRARSAKQSRTPARPVCQIKASAGNGEVALDRRQVLKTLGTSFAALVVSSQPAFAGAVSRKCNSVGEACDLEGEYSDPNHPDGYRTISLLGNTATIRGTDSKDGEEFVIKARVNGHEIKIDFSSKGGPKDVLGVYEGEEGKEGIKFPDGNVWAKKVAPKRQTATVFI